MKKVKAARQTELGGPASRLYPLASPRVGYIVGVSPEGAPVVDFPRNPGPPAVALSTVGVPPASLASAAERRQEAILLFDGGDLARPILVGLVVPPAPPEVPPVLEALAPGLPDLLEVDGRRVVIEGKDEIVLRCGEASITLRRNGRLVIKGAYVETHSKGTNRIKGGSVQIN